MNVDLRKADESLRTFAGKAVKSACYLPFVSLHLTPTGEVLACCRNQTFILGDLREQRITDIWNGGKIAALREALTDYKFNLGCSYCEWESQRRSDSFAIRLSADHFPVVSPQPEWPALIDFNVSNICNLECIMCCGENSSSIRGNLMGLPPLPKAYNDQFFDDLRPFLPHLHFINFLGGEPFLTPESYRVWDMMAEDGLAIPCRVTTNGTQYNARIERAMNAVPMHITVSLDGVTKETYESVRHRANFETVIANLHRFNAYTQERGTNFGISYCLMRQNWRELGDMTLFAEQLDCELSVSMVAGPSHCSLFTLPPHELREIVEEIVHVSAAVVPKLKRHRKAWDETLQHLRDATSPFQLHKIQKVMAFELASDTPLSKARKLAADGDYENALQKLEGIRRGHADSYFALALSGYILACQGDMESAVRDLEEALRISRKLPDAYVNLARVRLRQGDLGAALENALLAQQRVVPEERVESQVLVLLGLIYVRQWRLFKAHRAFARLAALPRPSCDGVPLPDSMDGARRFVAEFDSSAGRHQTRSLAVRIHALFRIAAAFHRTSAAIRNAGGIFRTGKPVSPGRAVESILPAHTTTKRGARWKLRVAGENNRARIVFPPGDRESVRIEIAKAGSGVSHDIQLNYANVECVADRAYHLKFRVRADRPRTFGFGIAMASAPWENLGLYRTLEADASWREIKEEFVSTVNEANGRLHFDLGGSGAPFEVASLVLTEIGHRSDVAARSSDRQPC
jgi:MoaA/NifB/PqqE/SkfB family radical SAM enzyme